MSIQDQLAIQLKLEDDDKYANDVRTEIKTMKGKESWAKFANRLDVDVTHADTAKSGDRLRVFCKSGKTNTKGVTKVVAAFVFRFL